MSLLLDSAKETVGLVLRLLSWFLCIHFDARGRESICLLTLLLSIVPVACCLQSSFTALLACRGNMVAVNAFVEHTGLVNCIYFKCNYMDRGYVCGYFYWIKDLLQLPEDLQ